jgi:V8-like Glu-specific endopeptidase
MSLIGKLNIVYRNQIDPRDGRVKDDVYIGTGFLIGSRYVLTAGHNLFYFPNEDFSKKWIRPDLLLFYPGFSEMKFCINGKILNKPSTHNDDDDDISPKASIITTHPKWREAEGKPLEEINTNPYDFGAFILDRDVHSSRNYFYPRHHEKYELDGKTVSVTGHPADKQGNMYTMDGKIVTMDDWRLHYHIDTHGGQSGSPVWYFDEKKAPICTAVHIGNHHGQLNTGTRLTHWWIKYLEDQWSISFNDIHIPFSSK